MVLARVRHIGRVFAVVLLVWTTVDLLDYGLCAGHRDPLPAAAAAPVVAPAPVPGASGTAMPHSHIHDCFCCSPYVDVQVPFAILVQYNVAWLLPPEALARPLLTGSRFYHPPLA